MYRIEDANSVPPYSEILDSESRAIVHCLFTVTGDYTGKTDTYDVMFTTFKLSKKDLFAYLQELHKQLVSHETRAFQRAHVVGVVIWIVFLTYTTTLGNASLLQQLLSYYSGLALAALSPYIGYGGIAHYYRQIVTTPFFFAV
eukprot:gene7704-9911_t